MDLPKVNYTVTNIIHAYKQAPWRIQRQWIGMFMLGVLGLAMVAALYLDVTSQAAIAGRSIQNLNAEVVSLQRDNANLETTLSELTSTSAMEQRAVALGYLPEDAGQLDYVIVPGYSVAKPDILAAPALKPSAPSVPPEYTESLLDWLDRFFNPLPASSLNGFSQ